MKKTKFSKITAVFLSAILIITALPYKSFAEEKTQTGLYPAGTAEATSPASLEAEFPAEISEEDTFVPGEVIAQAGSEEEAESIAAAYGLSLKSYAWGIAVFAAEDSETEVRRSRITRRAGLPPLYLNGLYRVPEDDGAGQGAAAKAFAALPDAWHHAEIETERAWEHSTGEGVTVAVIDTGIDIDHPEFRGQLLPNSYNAYTDQVGIEYVDAEYLHGSYVAGIIAASALYGGSGGDIAGVAPDAKLMVIKAERVPGILDWASAYRGVNYAADNGADIINASYGEYYSEDLSHLYDLERDIISGALAKDVLLVRAAGNARKELDQYEVFEEGISVTATFRDIDGNVIFDNDYSDYGLYTDISAPGTDIFSAVIGGYESYSGTSSAAPIVAGAAALVKSRHPEYSQQQLAEAVCAAVVDAGEPGWDGFYGYGKVNAYLAVLGEEGTYRVSFRPENGKEPYTVLAAPGEKLRFEASEPVKEGYFFAGWYTESGAAVNLAEPINGDMTLYAKWMQPDSGTFAEHFPDEEFRLAVLAFLNTDGGNRKAADTVSPDDLIEIGFVKSFDLNGMGIRDLSGIEYFVSLEKLYCGNNSLTKLDISRNTSLLELYCAYNQLKSLDLSANNLEVLICNNNYISELELSKSTKLRELNCASNWLTKLDLLNNSALTKLICYDNRITGLSFDGNNSLVYLDCEWNKISELDLAQCPNLKILRCGINLLTELDLSMFANLEWLTCNGNYMSQDPALSIIGWDMEANPPGESGDDSAFWYYPQNGPPAEPEPTEPFVPVEDIIDLPSSANTGIPLRLRATVLPSNATDKNIIWIVRDPGATGAVIKGSTLYTTAEGTVIISAFIRDMDEYDKYGFVDFEVTVTDRGSDNTGAASGGGSSSGKSGGSVKNAALSQAKASYNPDGGGDLSIRLEGNGNSLKSIRNGSYIIKEGADYSLNGNNCVIKSSYLETLSAGEYSFIFTMSRGRNPVLKVTVEELADAGAETEPEKLPRPPQFDLRYVITFIWNILQGGL